MIKANIILENYKWKHKLGNPNNYLKDRLKKLSKISYFKKKKSRIFNSFNKQ